MLEETIEYWKKQTKTSYGYYIEDVPKENEQQIKYIQQIFETGISKLEEDEHIEKKQEIDYKKFKDNLFIKVYNKWWIYSFIDTNIDYFQENENNPSLVLFYEFVTKQSNIDYSLGKLAKKFLTFLYKKYNISKETDKILKQIVYNNFIKGNLFIERSDIKRYENKYPEIMQQIYKSNLIINKNGKYYFINRYIYLYIAINEVDKNDYNLIEIIENWETYESNNEYIYENIDYLKQRIFEVYSAINRQKFNEKYVITALKCFTDNVQRMSKSKDKMKIARAITNMISWEIEIDKKFNVRSQFYHTYTYIPVIDFVMGIFVETHIALLDYAIYQKELYKKFYDYEEEVYRLDFEKIIEDKKLRDICSNIKVWDYLYDIYTESIKAIEKLQKDIKTDMCNIAKESFYKKYYI